MDRSSIGRHVYAFSFVLSAIQTIRVQRRVGARQLLSDVDAYRACIEDFIEEQNEAANEHQQASEDAVDEWNNFVAYELN